MPRLTKPFLAALAGLGPALLAELIAFLLAGAGHGWVTPLSYSLLLFLAWPATLVVLALDHPRRRLFCLLLLLAGLAADAALVRATLREGLQYFERGFTAGPVLDLIWIALWLGWQGAALVALLSRPPRRTERRRSAFRVEKS